MRYIQLNWKYSTSKIQQNGHLPTETGAACSGHSGGEQGQFCAVNHTLLVPKIWIWFFLKLFFNVQNVHYIVTFGINFFPVNGGGRQLAWTELVADLTHSRRRAGHLVIGDFFKHSTSWTPNLHTENWKQPEKYEYFEIDQDSLLKTIPVCDLFWNRVLLEKPEIGWWKHGRVGLVKLVDFYPQCIHCHIGWSENVKHFGYPELAWMVLFFKGKTFKG